MPYVNIKITNEGATEEQKAALIEGVTDLLAKTLGKNPATTVVVIEEVPVENWGIGGQSVKLLRQNAKIDAKKQGKI
jgi:4-oxalocrotonate tautomerase